MSEIQERPPDRRKQKTKAAGTTDEGTMLPDEETLVDEEIETTDRAQSVAVDEAASVGPKRTKAGEDKPSAKKEKTGSGDTMLPVSQEHKAPSLSQRMRFRRPFKK